MEIEDKWHDPIKYDLTAGSYNPNDNLKANELRIGNLVSYQNEEYQAHALGSQEVYLMDGKGTHPYGLISGIPLTEEWLLKFGIEKWFGNNRFEVRIEVNGYSIYAWSKGVSIFLLSGSYVHQFQNDVFTLTREELTLKS